MYYIDNKPTSEHEKTRYFTINECIKDIEHNNGIILNFSRFRKMQHSIRINYIDNKGKYKIMYLNRSLFSTPVGQYYVSDIYSFTSAHKHDIINKYNEIYQQSA